MPPRFTIALVRGDADNPLRGLRDTTRPGLNALFPTLDDAEKALTKVTNDPSWADVYIWTEAGAA